MIGTNVEMNRFTIAIFALILAIPSSVCARPPKGFHEGPYIRIIGGGMSVDFDNNVTSGKHIGSDFEGMFGLQFGWHLWDHAAAEIQGRYMTKKIEASREHVVLANLNLKYNFVTNILTRWDSFQILPFVSGGPSALISAIPSDPTDANGNFLGIWGLGFGGSLGIDFLVKKYVYLGVMGQIDGNYLTSGYATISGVRQKIVKGGWQPTLAILGAVGVHF